LVAAYFRLVLWSVFLVVKRNFDNFSSFWVGVVLSLRQKHIKGDVVDWCVCCSICERCDLTVFFLAVLIHRGMMFLCCLFIYFILLLQFSRISLREAKCSDFNILNEKADMFYECIR
jgi:hypothetical protein